MTGRVVLGLSGEERRALLLGWPVGGTVALSVTLFNIMTRRHDFPAQSVARAFLDEGSSALSALVAFVVPAAVALWMRRRTPPPWRLALGLLVGAIGYSALHVGGFVALRSAGYALLGMPYQFNAVAEFPYEFGKDAVAFAMATAGFWAMLRWPWPTAPAAAGAEPRWFEIRDGARLVRTPISEVVAVRAAGNYVEFLLGDGRRPMTRASLAAVEAELAPSGFVRTHRSWLVNASRVTGLRPEGSGDYVIDLGGVEVPLSRRWRAALETLRA